MHTQFIQATYPIVPAGCNIIKQKLQLPYVKEGDINQIPPIYQDCCEEFSDIPKCYVLQKCLDQRQVQKNDVNIEFPKFQFTEYEVVAFEFLKMHLDSETYSSPTIEECQMFINENKKALFMFSELQIDKERAYGYDSVPYIEYSQKTNCIRFSDIKVQIYFLKNKAGNIVCKHPCAYSLLMAHDTFSQISSRAFDRFCIGKFYEERFRFYGVDKVFKEWAARISDGKLSSFVHNAILNILLARSKSLDAFASFLASKLDFDGLNAQSIYAKLSSDQWLNRNEQMAIMEYAQAVRLE